MTVANLIRNSSSLSMYDRTKPHSASFSSGFGFHVEQKESQTDQLSISGEVPVQAEPLFQRDFRVCDDHPPQHVVLEELRPP